MTARLGLQKQSFRSIYGKSVSKTHGHAVTRPARCCGGLGMCQRAAPVQALPPSRPRRGLPGSAGPFPDQTPPHSLHAYTTARALAATRAAINAHVEAAETGVECYREELRWGEVEGGSDEEDGEIDE